MGKMLLFLKCMMYITGAVILFSFIATFISGENRHMVTFSITIFAVVFVAYVIVSEIEPKKIM